MEDMHNKKKSRLLPFFAFSMVTVLTSCNLFTRRTWKWEDSTSSGNINYCLLIGQLDHNDSMFRTRGTREILGTRVDKEQQKDNFNLEDVKQGELKLPGDIEKGVPAKKYIVNELEHLEQKSFSGATWDPITANGSAGTWISKHGKNITMFVSNNDGMAEGAIKAHNWMEGMPIFGYDANTSTLKLMLKNKILGTIDSNTAAQCLATSLLIRNIVEADKNGKIKELSDRGEVYNPTGAESGFTYAKPFGENMYGMEGTHMVSAVTLDGCEPADFLNPTSKSIHAILLNNRTVTNDQYVKKLYPDYDPDGVRTDSFFDKDGNALDTKAKYELSENPNKGAFKKNPNYKSKVGKINIWQSWYSNTDTFFTGNMDPFFRFTQAEDMFNIGVKEARSDGADESKNLNALESALSSGDTIDAFLINPVQQPNSFQYIKKIADKKNLTEQEDWHKRDNTPIIFWNRQPTDIHGSVEWDKVMNNKYFKYTYYIGFDAKQGGELQGRMVKAWLNKTYVENYKK